jgi:hypothetical protein
MVRLDQLTEEIRALPGLSRLQGLSACGPSASGETEITVHLENGALSDDQNRAIEETLARHLPDPQWGATVDEKDLAAILSRAEDSLATADLEKALRALTRIVDLQRPSAALTMSGSDAK